MTNSSLVPGLHQVTALMIQPKKLEWCNAALDEGSLGWRFFVAPTGFLDVTYVGYFPNLPDNFFGFFAQDVADRFVYVGIYWIPWWRTTWQGIVKWCGLPTHLGWIITLIAWNEPTWMMVKWDSHCPLTISMFFVYIQATLHGGSFAAVFRSHKLYYGTSESTMVYTLHHLWDEHVRKSWSIQIVIELLLVKGFKYY